MANFFLSVLRCLLGRCLFGADDDSIEAPAPLPTGYQSRTFYSSSSSPSTACSDHAQYLICRPSSSSTQSNISYVTKLRVSPLHDKVNKLSPDPPSSIEAQPVTRKSIATDLTAHRSYQGNSLMSPASPSPSPTALKPSTQKQMSNSFALSNANLVSSKRPLESSSTIPPTVPFSSPSTACSDHAQYLICRPSSSSTQSNISYVTKLRVSPLHDKVNKLSPDPPSSIEAQPVTRKLIATDLTAHRSYQGNSLMSPASPSPSPTALKPSTQKQMSNSFALSNANLVSCKRPLESSSTIPPTVPSITDIEKMLEVYLGNKGQSNSHYSNTSKSSSLSSDAPSSSSPLLSPKSDTKKVMTLDSPKQGTVTNSKYVWKVRNKNISTDKDLNTSPLDEPTRSLPALKPKVALSSDAPSSSSPLLSPKSDAKKVMTLDSPKQGTVTNSKYVWKVRNKNISTDKDLNTSPLDEPTRSLPALKPKVAIPVFKVPDELEHEFEGGKVPRILLTPLSQSTYREYFAALMYAEDYYCEKWSDYLLEEVVLEIREESTSDKNKKVNNVHVYRSQKNDRKKFVVFEIDSIPERRPYLLSRDFVHLKPTHKQIKPFEGIVLRVANSSFVHTQFGKDFHLQHTSTSKYDVSFSFNRVCLKRCHFAIHAITDSIFQNFLFPDQSLRVIDTDQDQEQVIFYNQALSSKERAAVGHILNLWCPPPYLLVGPLCMPTRSKSHTTSPCELSTTGRVIREAVLQIYRADPASRILIATPWNKTCDVLMQSLTNCIPAHELFRANAAFRAVGDVPDDILDLTMYNSEEECFAMTTLPDLLEFRVISTTFMSSFRLYNEGVKAGHFSHVFLADASSAIEPEVLVALVNLVHVMTAVVVTGSRGDCPNRIRSDISRKCGLKVSYFERLLKSSLYSSENPSFLSYL